MRKKLISNLSKIFIGKFKVKVPIYGIYMYDI